MEKLIIKCGKYVYFLGMICVLLFGFLSLVTLISGEYVAALFLMPFVFLGLALLVAYKKQTIEIDKQTITFNYVLKKPIEVRFSEIKCLLLIPLGNQVQMVLIDRTYARLVTIDHIYTNIEPLLVALQDHQVEVVDFAALLEEGKNVAKYVQAFNRLEKNYYKSLVEETQLSEKKDHTKYKKMVKVIGYLLVALDVIAYIVGGKEMLAIYIFVLLASYVLYLWFYPYMYIETKTKTAAKTCLQMPYLGAALALLVTILTVNLFGYDSGEFFKMTFIFMAILLIPFIIKSLIIQTPQSLSRKLSIACAMFFLAFTITFPVNFLLTFDKASHETIIVMDKDIDTSGSTTDYELIAMWRGKKEDFNVSKDLYNATDIGDQRRVCIRRSILGFEYYNLHK